MSREDMIRTYTSEIVQANDARLNGEITRQQHAALITRIDNSMNQAGITWDDVNNTWNQ